MAMRIFCFQDYQFKIPRVNFIYRRMDESSQSNQNFKAANCPRMKTWPVSKKFFVVKIINNARVSYSQISWFPIFRNSRLTRKHFTMTPPRAESFPVFPVFNVFVINHWSADTVSRVSWVSGPRCGSGNLAPPSVGVHYTTLHNAQIWNTRTLTFNRENLL